MMSLRKISFAHMAMTAAAVCVLGLVLWFAVGGGFPHGADGAGNNSPAKQPDPTGSSDHSTPPWAGEEQKAKAAEREAMRRKKFELYAELTKGLPELQPKLDGIPEFEVNGYERLRALTEAQEDVLPKLPKEIEEMLWEKRAWDSIAVQEYLAQTGDLLAELRVISRLPTGEIDWEASGSSLVASSFSSMRDLLLLAVLDAAYNRNPIAALDWMEVADRLARHFQGPQDADGITYSLGVLLQARIQRLAPMVAKRAGNIAGIQQRLDALLESHRPAPEDMAHYWRGDTVSTALTMILPMALRDPRSIEPLNFEELKSLLRLKFERNVREFEVMREASNFTDLKDRLDMLYKAETVPGGLSVDAKEVFEILCGDPRVFLASFVRCESNRQLTRAAVRLARDDSAPETILAEIAASEPEPRKLHYDPATRTLTSEPFLTETEKISIQVP